MIPAAIATLSFVYFSRPRGYSVPTYHGSDEIATCGGGEEEEVVDETRRDSTRCDDSSRDRAARQFGSEILKTVLIVPSLAICADFDRDLQPGPHEGDQLLISKESFVSRGEGIIRSTS